MSKRTNSTLFNPSSRFLRSADLVRDFAAPDAMAGYVLTDFGRECLGRIARGLKEEPRQRAFRLTGDYGTGKSSFALLLASGLDRGGADLPPGLRREFSAINEALPKADLVPVLVNGHRSRMGPAILAGLEAAMARVFPRTPHGKLAAELKQRLRDADSLTDDEVLSCIESAKVAVVEGGKGRGLLLILDEMGKFLEFSAANPEKQDVFLLQKLAESAARSGAAPLFVVCLLHQGFNAYSDQLTQASQHEWEKVAGRFDEIVFRQPLDQIVALMAAALGLDRSQVPAADRSGAPLVLDSALQQGWYGATTSRSLLRENIGGVWPVDAFSIPVLIRAFQRFGQNERSLFSFLFSYEPFALRAYCQREAGRLEPFRLHNLFDFIRANFGHRLAVVSYRSHWSTIESAIESFTSDDPTEIQVLKTIGLLNLINADDLLATETAVAWAVGGANEKVRSRVPGILKRLKSQNALFLRGSARGYALWSHSSVDIEARIEEAKRRVPAIGPVNAAVREFLDTRPLVARRHYIETGNLRYFAVHYCTVADLPNFKASGEADGEIVVPLCETEAEREAALAQAMKLKRSEDGRILLVAVPQALERLKGLLLERRRWEWIAQNTPELNSDPMARTEVSRFLQDAELRLQERVQDFIGLNRLVGRSALAWVHEGRRLKVNSGRDVLALLSRLCFESFPHAPRISNELVNRQTLSNSAAAARMRLIEVMLRHPAEPNLGVPADRRPPEISMYFSVLHAAGLHIKKKGKWGFVTKPAADKLNVRPMLEFMERTVMARPDERVSVKALFDTLKRPPFGLREGVLPVFLAVLAIVHEQELAFYETGTFVRDLDQDVFLRLTKAPERFEVQYCRIEGIRSELFQRLSGLLELRPAGATRTELLRLVKDLCFFVARLPEYSRNTKRLSKTTLAVRDAISQAREPIRLIFYELPVACGFAAFPPGKKLRGSDATAFARVLKEALSELRMAHPMLTQRFEQQMAAAFQMGKLPFGQVRNQLAKRAQSLLGLIKETRLKAFCVRMADANGGESDWIESVGSFLASRPPSKWTDDEEDTGERELATLAGRFIRAEGANPGATHGQGLRLMVTRADGEERESVVFAEPVDAKAVIAAETRLRAALGNDERVGLLAATKVLWECLDRAQKKS